MSINRGIMTIMMITMIWERRGWARDRSVRSHRIERSRILTTR